MTTPTAVLRDEHELILKALTILERLGRRLEAGEAVNRTTFAWLVDFFKTFVDPCHHAKEEQHLFPALERHGIPRSGGPVAVMLDEHGRGREILALMADGGDRDLAAHIRRYVEHLRDHIAKENSVLFPIAEHVLPEADKRTLALAFDAMTKTVAGPSAHARFLAELGRLEQD